MEVRKLTQSDWEQYKSVRLLSLRQSPQSFENSHDDEASLSDSQWMNRITPSDNAFIVGAFESSTLIGIAGFSRAQKAKICHKSYLWGVFVTPEHRTRGVGAELIGFLLFHAFNIDGISQMQLTVEANNVHAISLYEKYGFVQYGKEVDAIRIEDNSHDELLMACVKQKI